MPASVRRLLALAVIASWPSLAEGQSYVDGTIGSTSCSTYNVATRSCGGGTSTAYRTLAGAAAAAQAGNTFLVRGGRYAEPLTVSRSGTASQPIVFRNYQGETPTISGLSTQGIALAGRQYIEIDGFTVSDVTGWVRLEDSQHITIRNSVFQRATSTGTTGSIKLVRSSGNRIVNNVIEDGNDNIVLVDSADRNLVQGNAIRQGRHSLLSIRCSSFNVIRGNTFANTEEKAMEIFDCEGVGSDNPVRYDATRRNLIELNSVTATRASSKDNDYNGIQHGAQQTIVRRNVFRTSDGGGINYQSYANESLHVYGNRMYNNTFYANRCYAIIGDNGETADYRDMRVKNNLLYKNLSCSGSAQQTNIRDASTVILTNNAVETSAPGFVNEAAYDFHLAPGSRMIDAGGPLTTASAAGSGTSLRVQDATYFSDGFGIGGETGDTIQLGPEQVAVVTAIDYSTNTLTLDRPLTWPAGQGVSLQYAGSAMDQGAFESGSSAIPAPTPPSNLRIIR